MSAVQRGGVEIWKFGGASLADARAIQRAAGLITKHPGPLVVVASALAGVTDQLLEGANLAAAGKTAECTRVAAALLRRHRDLARELLPAGACGSRCSPRSMPRRASIASCAARSRCWATFHRAPATSWSRVENACRPRCSPPSSLPAAARPSSSTRRRSSRRTDSTAAPRRTSPRLAGARDGRCGRCWPRT